MVIQYANFDTNKITESKHFIYDININKKATAFLFKLANCDNHLLISMTNKCFLSIDSIQINGKTFQHEYFKCNLCVECEPLIYPVGGIVIPKYEFGDDNLIYFSFKNDNFDDDKFQIFCLDRDNTYYCYITSPKNYHVVNKIKTLKNANQNIQHEIQKINKTKKKNHSLFHVLTDHYRPIIFDHKRNENELSHSSSKTTDSITEKPLIINDDQHLDPSENKNISNIQKKINKLKTTLLHKRRIKNKHCKHDIDQELGEMQKKINQKYTEVKDKIIKKEINDIQDYAKYTQNIVNEFNEKYNNFLGISILSLIAFLII